MICSSCATHISKNSFLCPKCGETVDGGIVFVTGISGSGVSEFLKKVTALAESHGHNVKHHNIGEIMREAAETANLTVEWDRILDIDEKSLRLLRLLAIERISAAYNKDPQTVHIIDLHLCFRWRSYLTKGFEPRILDRFRPATRVFINVVEDLPKIQERLAKTSWGKREILELLIWRDEELLLADFFADASGLHRAFAIGASEPPSQVENLIWHPDFVKVYMSFPITNIIEDQAAKDEIMAFRDRMREFLVVFDPYALKDYDETYKREEMRLLRKQVGDVTEERDFRFIDQADALVAYFPRIVESKGVDAELNHAKNAGKPIFMYRPPGKEYGGPFVVPPDYLSSDPSEFLEYLKSKFGASKTSKEAENAG